MKHDSDTLYKTCIMLVIMWKVNSLTYERRCIERHLKLIRVQQLGQRLGHIIWMSKGNNLQHLLKWRDGIAYQSPDSEESGGGGGGERGKCVEKINDISKID